MLSKNKNITIAVLPFQIISNDTRIKNLFLGFTEDLITNFSKFVGLSVISSFSSNRIKDINNQNEVDQLKADYLVYGSVREHKNKLRISIQLIKTLDQSLVFGNQYNESIDALLHAQDNIVQQITTVLEEKINYNLLSHSYKKSSVELAAYENYLIGMSILQKGSGDHDVEARRYFNAALQIDPNYSLAYTGLSLSYFNFWSCLLWDRWDESMKGAHNAALKAIELDTNDYIALGVLGRTYVYFGEYEKAEYYLRKSLRMNMSDCSHLLRIAFSLMFLGYAEEAVALYHKAIELNPFHPNSYYAHGAIYYLHVGNFKQSIALAKKAPLNNWTDFPAFIAAAYLQIKDYDHMWQSWNLYLDLFKKQVYDGKTPMEAEALKWLITVNPFKGSNYLEPLVDYIKNNRQIVTIANRHPKTSNYFSLVGEVWEIAFQNVSVILKDAKGLRDIHKLIAQPNEEFHCLDLMEYTLQQTTSNTTIDYKAKTSYHNRIKALQIEIEEAESLNQTESPHSLTTRVRHYS